jgi:hypothetical protein
MKDILFWLARLVLILALIGMIALCIYTVHLSK